MSIHTGHRQRMKARYRTEGLDGFEEHQVLELLLFYCIPRRDTNVIAHNLLKRFGSLAQVMDAPARELEKIEGIGSNAAAFLKLVRDAGRRYQVSRVSQNKALRTIDECAKYLEPYFEGRTNETVFLLSLDAKCMVLNCQMVGEGGINSTGVPIRKIVDMALSSNATSVVLAHNHPSGIALPSKEDVQTTLKVAQALYLVDVVLNDHVIVADGDSISLAQSGMYQPEMVFDTV